MNNKNILLDKKPSYIKMQPITGNGFFKLKKKLNLKNLHTVCEEAKCPNISECWSQGTATIMILGDTCTRFCKFCNVKTGNPQGVVDQDEPFRVAEEIVQSGLSYVVLTCVDRDDLIDGGAGIFAETIENIKQKNSTIKVEALISDYRGSSSSLKKITATRLDVLAHNIETVEALTPMVRDRRASYRVSLNLLEAAKKEKPKLLTKSSIMLGLGETMEEVETSLEDLRKAGVDIVTLGQYLRPSKRHLSVKKYYSLEEFKGLEKIAREKGFLFVAAGPLVRSSYRAAELFVKGHLAAVS